MRRLLADSDGRADLFLAIGVWALAAAAFYGAAILPPPVFDPLGSAAVPKFVAVILAILAGLVVWRRWLLLRVTAPAAGEAEERAEAPPLRPRVAVASIVVMLAYVGVMAFGLLGFREATVPFVILLGGVMSRFRRSTMIVVTPLAFLLAFGAAWLFSGALYIDLPVARWLP